MIDTIYYLAGVSVLGSIGLGLLYLYDDRVATSIIEDFSWSAVRAYHRVNMETNNLRRYLENEFIEEKNSDKEESDEEYESENVIKFLGYNKDGSIYTSIQLKNNNYIEDEHFDMMFLVNDSEGVYKRINEKVEITNECIFEQVKKPFLSVEIEQNGERISIHDKLKQFYINGNVLLDRIFLQWYLETFHGMNLEEGYKIHIIDSNIEMKQLQYDQSVTIQSNDQLYLVTQV